LANQGFPCEQTPDAKMPVFKKFHSAQLVSRAITIWIFKYSAVLARYHPLDDGWSQACRRPAAGLSKTFVPLLREPLSHLWFMLPATQCLLQTWGLDVVGKPEKI